MSFFMGNVSGVVDIVNSAERLLRLHLLADQHTQNLVYDDVDIVNSAERLLRLLTFAGTGFAVAIERSISSIQPKGF